MPKNKIFPGLLGLISLLLVFFSQKPALAAPPAGKVGFGPVQLNIGSQDITGDLEVDIKTEVGDYHFSTTKDGGCPPRQERGPCLGQQILDVNPNGKTSIQITGVRRIINGNVDTGGMITPDPTSLQWSLFPEEETSWITFGWSQVVMTPKISLSDKTITKNGTEYITFDIPDPKAVHYTASVTANGGLEVAHLELSCANSNCSINSDSQGFAQDVTYSNNALSFKLPGSRLSNNSTYQVSITYAQNQRAQIQQDTFIVSDNTNQSLHLQLNPDTLNEGQTKNATTNISVNLTNGSSGQSYKVELAGYNSSTFNCSGPDCSTSLALSNLPGGNYLITAVDTKNNNITGSATLHVSATVPSSTGGTCSLMPSPPHADQSLQLIASNLEKNQDYRADLDGGSSLTIHTDSVNSGSNGFVIINLTDKLLKGSGYSVYLYKSADNSRACAIENFSTDSLPPPTPCTRDQPEKGECPTSSGSDICNSPNSPGIKTAIGCIHTDPVSLIRNVITLSGGVAGGVSLLMMLLGAFQMITSAGNPQTLKAGQDRFTSAIIGLLLVVFSVLLLQIIGIDILRIPGFAP